MALSEKEMKIGKEVYGINLLTPFPLSVNQIADWSKCINELKPDLQVEELKQAMDKLKLGTVEFNHQIGIQNIFNALRSLERPMVY